MNEESGTADLDNISDGEIVDMFIEEMWDMRAIHELERIAAL